MKNGLPEQRAQNLQSPEIDKTGEPVLAVVEYQLRNQSRNPAQEAKHVRTGAKSVSEKDQDFRGKIIAVIEAKLIDIAQKFVVLPLLMGKV